MDALRRQMRIVKRRAHIYNIHMNDLIREKLKLLPDAPGVYRMLNAAGEIIYVGKAVNLKNRVRSYFRTEKNRPPKVAAMVSHIADFEYILCQNEMEALTLEASLTKTLQPRYNILLKDDKHFPYVRLDEKKDFPRFEVVRRVKNDGARYFGPYLSGIALRECLNLIRDSFPVRHCRKDIARAIARGERPCLMYHLNKCCAPCSGKVSREEYHALLESVCSFLEGKNQPVIDMLTKQMQDASDRMEFEKAAQYRDRIEAVKRLAEKQHAMGTGDADRDVFALVRDGEDAVIHALFVRGDDIVGSAHYRMATGGEPAGEITGAFLQQFYAEDMEIPREIVVLDLPENHEALAAWLREKRGRAVTLIRPRRGERLQQVMMAQRNGVEAIEKQHALETREWERTGGAMARLAAILGLAEVPSRVECFDNSHIQGRDTVSSMVVFCEGKPAPKEYRRYRIRSAAGGDDLVSMREALTRRFTRLKDGLAAAERGEGEAPEAPGLLVVDGGRTQLTVALQVLSELGLSHIPAIGLAERHEEIILPDEPEPILLARNDPALHVLERLRDEAHRFAITYHRSLHVRTALLSELDAIPGVGEKRKRLLFDAFVTRDAIAAADVEALAAVHGMSRPAAEAVYAHFHPAPAAEAGAEPGSDSE